MTFEKETMVKFKNFLDSQGMFDYFCKAFLDFSLNRSHTFSIDAYSIINSFDWGRADHRYRPPMDFGRLDAEWCKIYPKDFSNSIPDREVFIEELKSLDKTRVLLRAARGLS